MFNYFKYRYTNKALLQMEFILSSIYPMSPKELLKAIFHENWKHSIYESYYDGKSVEYASAMASLLTIRHIVGSISSDDRELALFAIKAGNGANPAANRFLEIIDRIKLVGRNEVIYEAACAELGGALQGLQGAPLDDFRTAHLIDGAIRLIDPE